jgi:hypothetical protein
MKSQLAETTCLLAFYVGNATEHNIRRLPLYRLGFPPAATSG